MKFTIALFALFAAANAQYITTGGLYGAPLLSAPVAGILPSSRLTRSDWVQPGLRYNVPAVAQYQTITPGFTTVQQTATPLVAHAPVVATTGIIGGAYTARLAAPLGAVRYIRK